MQTNCSCKFTFTPAVLRQIQAIIGEPVLSIPAILSPLGIPSVNDLVVLPGLEQIDLKVFVRLWQYDEVGNVLLNIRLGLQEGETGEPEKPKLFLAKG